MKMFAARTLLVLAILTILVPGLVLAQGDDELPVPNFGEHWKCEVLSFDETGSNYCRQISNVRVISTENGEPVSYLAKDQILINTKNAYVLVYDYNNDGMGNIAQDEVYYLFFVLNDADHVQGVDYYETAYFAVLPYHELDNLPEVHQARIFFTDQVEMLGRAFYNADQQNPEDYVDLEITQDYVLFYQAQNPEFFTQQLMGIYAGLEAQYR